MIDTLANLPLISPFIEFGFMRRALAGCLALSLGATPIGVFLMLRRMSLAGDAISHAILPGAAIGYLIAGLSLSAMTLGGLVAGIAVALLAGGVARNSVIKEDTSLYLDNQQIDPAQLGAALDRLTAGDKQKTIFVRGDKGVDYADLMSVMDNLRGAGYLKIGLVGLETVGKQ